MNVVSTERGAIRKRFGSKQFMGSGQRTGTGVPESLASVLIPSSGARFMLLAGGGKVWAVTSAGEKTELGSGFTSNRWSVVQAPLTTTKASQGPVFLSNGKDTPQYWNGSLGSKLKAWEGTAETVRNKEAFAGSGHIPNGRFSVFANERVFMAGVEGAPSTVYFSDIAELGAAGDVPDASLWPAANNISFDPSDGQAITGIGVAGPYILVFKPNKTWVIHNASPVAARKLSDTVGCVAHRSIVETADGTMFLTADQGVYVTNGSSLKEMSYPIRPTLLAANGQYKENAAGAYFNNHYYLSFPSAGSTVNNRTVDFDLALKSWWLHDVAGAQWTVGEPVVGEQLLFVAKQETEAGICQAFVPNVYTDFYKPAGGSLGDHSFAGNGKLGAYWVSPWEPFAYYIFRHRIKAPFLKKRLRAVFFDGSGVIQPLVFKNFGAGEELGNAVVGNAPISELGGSEEVMGAGEPKWMESGPGWEESSWSGHTTYWGGEASVAAARMYSLGVGRAWGVGFGNNTAEPFEVDSYAYMIQFRKS